MNCVNLNCVVYYKNAEDCFINLERMIIMFKKIINKKTIIVIMNGGPFHVDEVACVALLKLVYKEVIVIRKSKVDLEIEDADYNLGIGGINRVSDTQVVLDQHHSLELIDGTQIKHCTFSKLIEYMLDNPDPLFKKYLMNELILPVSFQENGQNCYEFGLISSPLGFVNAMRLSWKDDKKLSDYRFSEVVEIATKVIEIILKNIKDDVEAYNIAKKAIKKAKRNI